MTDNKNISGGFIAIYRQLLNWEWYKDTNVKTLFIHCLLKANWHDKSWQGIMIVRGSFITSVDVLSQETGLTIQQVRTCISKLKKTNEITTESTNKYTVLSIVKYDVYQKNNDCDNNQDSNQITIEQQPSNNQITTTNNINNNKELKKNLNIYTSDDKNKPKEPNLKELVTEEKFIEIWGRARLHYDDAKTTFKKLTTAERELFILRAKEFDEKQFEGAIAGLFFQNTLPVVRVRPAYLLKEENFTTYLDNWMNQSKMFDNSKEKGSTKSESRFQKGDV